MDREVEKQSASETGGRRIAGTGRRQRTEKGGSRRPGPGPAAPALQRAMTAPCTAPAPTLSTLASTSCIITLLTLRFV